MRCISSTQYYLLPQMQRIDPSEREDSERGGRHSSGCPSFLYRFARAIWVSSLLVSSDAFGIDVLTDLARRISRLDCCIVSTLKVSVVGLSAIVFTSTAVLPEMPQPAPGRPPLRSHPIPGTVFPLPLVRE